LSAGTSELLKKGAKLVTGVQDVLEELSIGDYILRKEMKKQDLNNLSEDEKNIYKILENESLHIDEIAKKMGTESGKVGSILSLMEIKGILRNSGEGVYGRT
jgi:DNA processing protein